MFIKVFYTFSEASVQERGVQCIYGSCGRETQQIMDKIIKNSNSQKIIP